MPTEAEEPQLATYELAWAHAQATAAQVPSTGHTTTEADPRQQQC